ncbi:MAG: hypothetical protein CALGDGBN_03035 [Pseudomonadales bacterium]|nr:hypothetical protein [Pseudomonadales bacterium]
MVQGGGNPLAAGHHRRLRHAREQRTPVGGQRATQGMGVADRDHRAAQRVSNTPVER